MRKIFISLMLSILFITMLKAQDSMIVSNNNKFAFELFNKTGVGERNCFISPFSISTAMAMTYAGAREQTEKQISTVFHFSSNSSAFHKEFYNSTELVRAAGSSDGLKLNFANAIWLDKSLKLEKKYKSVMKKSYKSGFTPVDFASAPEAARTEINQWVAGKTENKIEKLLIEGDVDNGTALVLTNAIYFKGNWTNRFNEEKSQQGKFKVREGESVEVTYMNITEKFRFLEMKGMQVVELPYEGNRVSMYVILPDPNKNIDAFIGRLTPEAFEKGCDAMKETKISLQFPKFKYESRYELQSVLGEMGMPDAFGSGADFSGITGGRDLYISKVVHKAFIEVNEKGSEAAAATAVVMRKNAEIPKQVVVDRPFVFLIRDNMTGAVLFLGKVVNPNTTAD